ncbi:hypothetical protein GCM10020218_024970 [Dactylosporangium vinaceum]
MLHWATWTTQFLTRAAMASPSQAKKASPCIEDASPDDRAKPASVPLAGYAIENVSAGIGTGWVAGHAPPWPNETWSRWLGLSRCRPSQQSGNRSVKCSVPPSQTGQLPSALRVRPSCGPPAQ